MKQASLTIGALATAAEVNVETIRYYQRRRLIDEPAKPAQGYRIYSQDTLKRIIFIKRAQKLGFSLNEIEELLQLGGGQCSDVRLRAEQKCEQIDKQIKDLKNLRATLTVLINSCHKDSDTAHCAIVETLSAN